jgi:glycosyltransferase involved in cell wall biosynthesis
VNARPPEGREHPSVGLVHDYLLTMRGAERTFAAIADCWPDAPIYTTLYSEQGTELRFGSRQVHTSYLQQLGVRQHGFRRLLPLYPRAVERLPVSRHDLVVSSSSAFAHGVRPRAGAVHICYCHSPFRYAWHENELALEEAPWIARPLARRMLGRIRRWDLAAAARVTHYIANSALTRERIHAYYGRESTIVHPPVDIDWLEPGTPGDYFLVVTELASHKRVHVALEAARAAGKPIKVVGAGPELGRLRARFGDSAEFLGRVSTDELARLYPGALALLVPNVEEFGIAAVEAQAAGRPVVPVDAGGTRETVANGDTGVLVDDPSSDAFAEVLREVDFERFSSAAIRRHAEQFSRDRFVDRFTAEVSRLTSAASNAMTRMP